MARGAIGAGLHAWARMDEQKESTLKLTLDLDHEASVSAHSITFRTPSPLPE